jgi:hypothetical protein
LSKCLENASPKLGEFVEKQHAVVGKADLARARNLAPADQCGLADRMMRGTKRSTGDDTCA